MGTGELEIDVAVLSDNVLRHLDDLIARQVTLPWRETWGLVANEALACGLPIILSDAVGSAPDLAGDGSAGRVFPVGDVVALAEAIGQLLDNRPRPEAIAGKSTAYSLERAADGILQAVALVADPRARSNAKGAYLRET